MTRAQVVYAQRKAMDAFDKWNDVAGVIETNSGYYSEIEAVIEDAVHIGIQMALFGKIDYDEEGNVKQPDTMKLLATETHPPTK